MEFEKIVRKIREIKADAEYLRSLPELEPCFVACLDSILSHTELMCNELGLDVGMQPTPVSRLLSWNPETGILDDPE